MQDGIEAMLHEAGYQHYETSAFAKPGHRARHNLNYWTFGDYLGLGAGAHGKISFRDRIVREVRERKPQVYLKAALGGDAVWESREVTDAELSFEFMLNALRLVEGFPITLFAERTGLTLDVVEPQLARAESAGLIERDHKRIAPSEKGRRFLNDLLEMFLEAPPGGQRRKTISICSAGTARPS
jgi:oxygen-independent coproporphyrinogen-3 oxidase